MYFLVGFFFVCSFVCDIFFSVKSPIQTTNSILNKNHDISRKAFMQHIISFLFTLQTLIVRVKIRSTGNLLHQYSLRIYICIFYHRNWCYYCEKASPNCQTAYTIYGMACFDGGALIDIRNTCVQFPCKCNLWWIIQKTLICMFLECIDRNSYTKLSKQKEIL